MNVKTATAAVVLILSFSVPAPCQIEPAPAINQRSLQSNAEDFVKAINSGSAAKALRLVDLPFAYRNQEWKDSDTGPGYVLGAAHDQEAPDQQSATMLITEIVRDVRVAHTTPERDAPTKAEMLNDYLAKAPSTWQHLELFFFVRGTGDVEHVVLIGVDPATGKIRGVYSN